MAVLVSCMLEEFAGETGRVLGKPDRGLEDCIRRDKMLTEYIGAALKKARYKKLDDDSWFAEIPDFEGVWANAGTVEECRSELREVLEEWMVLKIRDRAPLPTLGGLNMEIRKEDAA